MCLPPADAGRVITNVCPAQMGNKPLGNSCFTIETKSQTPLRREKNIINLTQRGRLAWRLLAWGPVLPLSSPVGRQARSAWIWTGWWVRSEAS